MAGHCVQSDIPPGVLFKLSIQTNDEIKIFGIPFKTHPSFVQAIRALSSPLGHHWAHNEGQYGRAESLQWKRSDLEGAIRSP
jgi:hypothetical protein